MSEQQTSSPTRRTYQSERDERTATPSVYRRNDYYRVLWRPDGKRKKMERFATYEEAVAFKESIERPRRDPEPRMNRRLRYLLNDPCPFCGERSETFDHIQPQAEGGSHHWSNIVGACPRCNLAKSDSALLLFLLARRAPLVREGGDLFAFLA